MDGNRGSELYSFQHYDRKKGRGIPESWDYGRLHSLPIWPEFVLGSRKYLNYRLCRNYNIPPWQRFGARQPFFNFLFFCPSQRLPFGV